MDGPALLAALRASPERLPELAGQAAGLLTLAELEGLLSPDFCARVPKVRLGAALVAVLAPHYPASLPLLGALADAHFRDHQQFRQTLRLEYLQQVVAHTPGEARAHVAEVDRLVGELRDKDASVRLVRAQTLQVHYHLLLRNLQKAKQLLMSARAHKVRLPADAQRQLDYISGCVMLFCAEYGAAANYFAEGCLYVQQAVAHVLAGEHQEVDRLVAQVGRREGVAEDTTRALHKVYRLNLLVGARRHLPQLRALAAELRDDCPSFEMRHALDRLVEAEVRRQVLRALGPYTKIQIGYLSELTELGEADLAQLLGRLIVDDRLDYIIDGATGCLIRNAAPPQTSERLLRDASELVEALAGWFK